jgi:hypothetical protein
MYTDVTQQRARYERWGKDSSEEVTLLPQWYRMDRFVFGRYNIVSLEFSDDSDIMEEGVRPSRGLLPSRFFS